MAFSNCDYRQFKCWNKSLNDDFPFSIFTPEKKKGLCYSDPVCRAGGSSSVCNEWCADTTQTERHLISHSTSSKPYQCIIKTRLNSIQVSKDTLKFHSLIAAQATSTLYKTSCILKIDSATCSQISKGQLGEAWDRNTCESYSGKL